jgi:hypothetical protein
MQKNLNDEACKSKCPIERFLRKNPSIRKLNEEQLRCDICQITLKFGLCHKLIQMTRHIGTKKHINLVKSQVAGQTTLKTEIREINCDNGLPFVMPDRKPTQNEFKIELIKMIHKVKLPLCLIEQQGFKCLFEGHSGKKNQLSILILT